MARAARTAKLDKKSVSDFSLFCLNYLASGSVKCTIKLASFDFEAFLMRQKVQDFHILVRSFCFAVINGSFLGELQRIFLRELFWSC